MLSNRILKVCVTPAGFSGQAANAWLVVETGGQHAVGAGLKSGGWDSGGVTLQGYAHR